MIDMHAHWRPAELADALRSRTTEPRIVKGADVLKLYQFNTRTARHFFCSNCGIYTHHQRRSNPNEYGYNVGCLEGVNPFDLGPIATHDGVNHPADRRD